jgi:glycosyltransferase involved in cell wall biosynthesis
MSELGISIVIPAYNEEKFLPDTLKAVKRSQTNFIEGTPSAPPTEIVVVNNASTDKTSAIAEEFGARVVNFEKRNISAARNEGIRASRYSIIVMIDADSFLPENSLSEVFKLMKKGETIGGAFNVELITKKKVLAVVAPLYQSLVRAVAGISGAMFFFDRDSALAMGGFREDRLVAEDSSFSIDLRAHGKSHGRKQFVYLKEVTVGTLDRKKSDLLTTIQWVSKAVQAFFGRKQEIEDLDYWYKPKR